MFAPSTLLVVALKSTLLIALSSVVCLALARTSAAYRHVLWAFALSLSLLMPFAIHWIPAYVEIPVPWQMLSSATATSESATPGSTENLWSPIMVLWASGTAALLLRQVLAHIGLWRWTRKSRALHSTRWRATLERIASEQDIDRTLRVLESARITSPCTWGFLRPILLLPSVGERWSEAERRHALLHELAHLHRLDYVSDLMARIACAVHWYNPAVWFAAGEMRRLQERACDDAVLHAGGTPSDYAQFLLNVAAQSNHRSPLRLAMNMVRRSPLHGRVVAILDPCQARRQPSPLIALVAFLSLTGLALLLATAATVTKSDAQVRDPVDTPVDPADTPASPAIPARPAVPATPALPALPAVPATPAVPALPTMPAIPAIPALPPLPTHTGPTASLTAGRPSAL